MRLTPQRVALPVTRAIGFMQSALRESRRLQTHPGRFGVVTSVNLTNFAKTCRKCLPPIGCGSRSKVAASQCLWAERRLCGLPLDFGVVSLRPFTTRLVQNGSCRCGSTGVNLLFLLEPPYRSQKPISPRPSQRYPAGSIVCAIDSNLLASLCDLLVTLHSCPWVLPSIVVVHQDVEFVQPIVRSMSTLDGRLACVLSESKCRTPRAPEVLGAFKARCKPTASVMARYVALRLGSPEILDPLEHQFSDALQGSTAPTDRSVATYCRLFQRYGRLTARDWRAIARLADFISRLQGLNELGASSRWDRYCRKYLDLRLRAATSAIGWETVLERALLCADYRVVAPSRSHTETGALVSLA
jgi:hypothetical protein